MHVTYGGRGIIINAPNLCPHCHNGIQPIEVYASLGNDENGMPISYSFWRCTFHNCNKLFAAVHAVDSYNSKFIGYLDGNPISPHWPSTILELESKFITTYIQALKAENSGLDEIAGMGYRKAIEYLVKDYLIKHQPEKRAEIEDALLAKVIKNYFVDSRESDLKDLLLRATWLGNDMTHYLKYHENFDIDDLKELIKLVMDEIHSISQKRHYLEKLQAKTKNASSKTE